MYRPIQRNIAPLLSIIKVRSTRPRPSRCEQGQGIFPQFRLHPLGESESDVNRHSSLFLLLSWLARNHLEHQDL
jgi:hypothetical protein